MVIQSILWLFEGMLLWAYGRLSLRVLNPGRQLQAGFWLTLLLGLVTVTSLASILSLWMNLGALALSILTLGGILIWVWEWRQEPFSDIASFAARLKPNKTWILISLGLLALILDLSTRRVSNPDTGIYHAQAIHWLEVYPAVPGLGNLHTRLAFNSAWLVINALFSFAFLGGQSFHALPGLLYGVFALYGLGGVYQIFQGAARPSDWLRALLLPAAIFSLGAEASSPGTDLPAILWFWFLLSEWFSEQERPDSQALRPMLIGLCAIFAITLKLSVAPVALFAVLVFFQYLRQGYLSEKLGEVGGDRQGAYKRASILVVVGGLILVPWLARNWVLSGYLVYPLPALDIFNPDWKIPATIAQREQVVIQAWARIPREQTAIVQAMPLTVWAKVWYLNQGLIHRLMLWGIGLGLLGLVVGALVPGAGRAKFRAVIRRYAWGYLVCLLSLGYWFLGAPDFRFGVGFVLATLILISLPWLGRFEELALKQAHWITLALLCLVILTWGLQIRSIGPRTILQRIWLPTNYGSLSTAPCQLKNATILCAEWYNECWYTAFPCVPAANPEVSLRGTDFSEGFRHDPP